MDKYAMQTRVHREIEMNKKNMGQGKKTAVYFYCVLFCLGWLLLGLMGGKCIIGK